LYEFLIFEDLLTKEFGVVEPKCLQRDSGAAHSVGFEILFFFFLIYVPVNVNRELGMHLTS
jgi:hypothetical protein